MSFNIKDPEAHALAKALAHETGETLTRAVVEALRERLVRTQRQHQVEERTRRIMEIGRRYAEQMKGPVVSLEEMLYDEKGMPK